MNKLVRKLATSTPVIAGGVLLAGVSEFVALQRSRRRRPKTRHAARQAA